MTTMIEGIHFPAILLNSRCDIEYVENEAAIMRPVLLDLQKGFYKNIQIIAPDSRLFTLIDATPVQNLGTVLLFVSRYIYSPRVSVRFRSITNRPISSGEAVSLVTMCMKKHKSFWSAGGDFSQIIEEVEGQKDANSLVEYVGKLMRGSWPSHNQ